MLVNATVSHELRNPLNSLLAQNILNTTLYDELKKIARDSSVDITIRNKILLIGDQLQQGLHIQESTANLMVFLVQDLLDYSQIRAGKFRKNIKEFNIRDAIEEVMCI